MGLQSAQQISPGTSNNINTLCIDRPDVQAGHAELLGRFHHPYTKHSYLEPGSCMPLPFLLRQSKYLSQVRNGHTPPHFLRVMKKSCW